MIWLNTDQFSSVQTQLQHLRGQKLKTEISIRYCAELRDSEATVIEVSSIRQHRDFATTIVGTHSRRGSKITWWSVLQGPQSGQENMAADIEFYFGGRGLLALLCFFILSFHFLANSVPLAV